MQVMFWLRFKNMRPTHAGSVDTKMHSRSDPTGDAKK